MREVQFSDDLHERALQLAGQPALQKKFMLKAQDTLDWKIATEMLKSWLGLREKSAA